MPQFYPLTVVDVRHDTRDSVVVTLEPRPEDKAAFDFVQGQYLTFKQDFDGEELRRSYSICAGLGEEPLRVGIRKVEGGCFSGWANEELQAGATLQAMPPMGTFHGPIEPQKSKSYLLFAGGSGITPVLGIIRTILSREPNSNLTLVYGNRATNTIMFREELEDLKNSHLGRFNIIHILETEAPDIDLFTGRVDREKCDALFANWIDVKSADMAFICGPEPMMLAISEALKAHGLAADRIKFELFASNQPGRAQRKAAATGAHSAADTSSVTIRLNGESRQIEVPRDGTRILDAAISESIDAPFACKAGVCSTCRAMVVEGNVEMATNYALEDYEVRRGYVLTCQSTPLTDKVVLDYDK